MSMPLAVLSERMSLSGAAIDFGNVITDMADTESRRAMFLQQSGELTGVQVITIVGHKGIIRGRQLLWRQVAVAEMSLGTHGIDKTDPCPSGPANRMPGSTHRSLQVH